MAGRAVGRALDQFFATVPRVAFRGIGFGIRIMEISRSPQLQAPTLIEWKRNIVFRRWFVYGRDGLESSPKIGDVLISHVRVKGIGECRVIGFSVRADPPTNRVGKLVRCPVAYAMLFIRCQVGRIKCAEFGRETLAACQRSTSALDVSMTGYATGHTGKVCTALHVACERDRQSVSFYRPDDKSSDGHGSQTREGS